VLVKLLQALLASVLGNLAYFLLAGASAAAAPPAVSDGRGPAPGFFICLAFYVLIRTSAKRK